jgi:hypothetical protein
MVKISYKESILIHTDCPNSNTQVGAQRGGGGARTGASLPNGGALQTVYLLVELSNDAVQFCDAFLIPKRGSLLDVLMFSHEVRLLTLRPRGQDTRADEFTHFGE